MKVRGFIIVCQPPPERALSLSEVEEVEEKEEEEEEKEARKSFVTVINISPPINCCLHTTGRATFKQDPWRQNPYWKGIQKKSNQQVWRKNPKSSISSIFTNS